MSTAPDADHHLFELPSGATLEIRPTSRADGQLLADLYSQLSVNDLRRRFFTGAGPPVTWCETWAAVGERDGHGIVAVVHAPDGDRVVGEAGYAPLADGDGDLGVTVAPAWRGWLGAYLVDVLARHAAERGVRNLRADVLLDNAPMLGVLRHRGAVARAHPDGTVQLSIATTGRVPSFPPRAEGLRLLVETPGGRWAGEDAAEAAGCVTALCAGPARRGRDGCPVLAGGRCPLADAADAIVVLLDLDDADHRRLVALHHQNLPGTPIFVGPGSLAVAGPDIAGCTELTGDDADAVSRIVSVVSGPTARHAPSE